MFAYRAICVVPTDTLLVVTWWLSAHRRRIGTRTGRRAGNPRTQAKLVLRWMPDDAPARSLAHEAGCPSRRPTATCTRPSTSSPITPLTCTRSSTGAGRKGLVARQRGRDPARDRPRRHPRRDRASPVVLRQAQDPGRQRTNRRRPGRVPDLVVRRGARQRPRHHRPRAHCLPALYAAAGAGLPTLADKGYTGAGIGVHTPIKGRGLAVDNTTYNTLLTAIRAIGERANGELKERWRCLRRIRLCPKRIGTIVSAAIVLSTLQRGHY